MHTYPYTHNATIIFADKNYFNSFIILITLNIKYVIRILVKTDLFVF